MKKKGLSENTLYTTSQKLRFLKPFDAKDSYGRLSEKQLDEAIDKHLNTVLAQNLFELKTFINYDLKLDKPERYAVFWNFVGNPLYRLLEKGFVEDCRNSERYRKKLFEKIDVLINELRPDKELLRESMHVYVIKRKRRATEDLTEPQKTRRSFKKRSSRELSS